MAHDDKTPREHFLHSDTLTVTLLGKISLSRSPRTAPSCTAPKYAVTMPVSRLYWYGLSVQGHPESPGMHILSWSLDELIYRLVTQQSISLEAPFGPQAALIIFSSLGPQGQKFCAESHASKHSSLAHNIFSFPSQAGTISIIISS